MQLNLLIWAWTDQNDQSQKYGISNLSSDLSHMMAFESTKPELPLIVPSSIILWCHPLTIIIRRKIN